LVTSAEIKRNCFTPFINRTRENIANGKNSLESTIASALKHDRFQSLNFKIGGHQIEIPHALVFNAVSLSLVYTYELARAHGLNLPGAEILLGNIAVASIYGSGTQKKDLGDGIIVEKYKNGAGVIKFTKGGAGPIAARGLREEEIQYYFRKSDKAEERRKVEEYRASEARNRDEEKRRKDRKIEDKLSRLLKEKQEAGPSRKHEIDREISQLSGGKKYS